MKRMMLVFALGLGLFQAANAQDKKVEEAANYAADYMCNCVNKVYAGVDNEVRDVLIRMFELPAEEQGPYVESLSQALQTRLVEQSLLMANEEKTAEFDACNNKMLEELDRKYGDVKDESNYSEADVVNLMIDRLAKKKKCEFTHFLLKVGLSAQNQENSDDIEENENGGGTDGGEEGQ